MIAILKLNSSVAALLAAAAALATSVGCAPRDTGTTYMLYFLGGQSNMDGYGFTKQLPIELNAPVRGVWIFHGNPVPDDSSSGGLGLWAELNPGHGVGFSSDGKENFYSDRFGVELTFALRLQELAPDDNVAIVKYSRGGTSIDTAAAGRFGCWDPEYVSGERGNQYDHFLTTLNNAMAVSDINGDGADDTLVPSGIIWMQGESDAFSTEEIALRYEDNLARLMGAIRSVFDDGNLPIVLGRISDSGQDEDGVVWDHGDIVQAAQESFAKSDEFAALVTSTDYYHYSDAWHYDTEGYIDLGRKFAEAVFRLKH